MSRILRQTLLERQALKRLALSQVEKRGGIFGGDDIAWWLVDSLRLRRDLEGTCGTTRSVTLNSADPTVLWCDPTARHRLRLEEEPRAEEAQCRTRVEPVKVRLAVLSKVFVQNTFED